MIKFWLAMSLGGVSAILAVAGVIGTPISIIIAIWSSNPVFWLKVMGTCILAVPVGVLGGTLTVGILGAMD